MSCRICQSDEVSALTAREHLTGSGEAFAYLECAACGCLQIAEVPADLSPYYGGAYGTAKHSHLKKAIRTTALRLVYPGGAIGKAIGLAFPWAHAGVLTALRERGVPSTASILDVGAGAGRLLEGLRALGFGGRLVGIDPFLPADETTLSGVQLRRQTLDDVTEPFDVVTLVHTLEHIADQYGTMRAIERVLAPNGICLISIPVTDGWAWRAHRTNWVQLDPPRHLFLHSPKSFEMVARAAQLDVVRTIWDSTSFQFWGSALVTKQKPVLPMWRSWVRAAWRVPFDCARAARMNASGSGDQATFVLTRASQ